MHLIGLLCIRSAFMLPLWPCYVHSTSTRLGLCKVVTLQDSMRKITYSAGPIGDFVVSW